MCCWNPKIQVRGEYLVSVNESHKNQTLLISSSPWGRHLKNGLGRIFSQSRREGVSDRGQWEIDRRAGDPSLLLCCVNQTFISEASVATQHSPPPLHAASGAWEVAGWGPVRRPLCRLGWGCLARSRESRTQSHWTANVNKQHLVVFPHPSMSAVLTLKPTTLKPSELSTTVYSLSSFVTRLRNIWLLVDGSSLDTVTLLKGKWFS